MSKKYIPSEDIGEPLMSDWKDLEQLVSISQDLKGRIDLALRALDASAAASWEDPFQYVVIARDPEQNRVFAVLLQYDKDICNVTYKLGSFPLGVGADEADLMDWTIYTSSSLQLSADIATIIDQTHQAVERELDPYLKFVSK